MISTILVSLNLRHRHLSVNRASREQDILSMTRLQEMCATWTSRREKNIERVIDQTIGRLARVLHKTEIRRFTRNHAQPTCEVNARDERVSPPPLLLYSLGVNYPPRFAIVPSRLRNDFRDAFSRDYRRRTAVDVICTSNGMLLRSLETADVFNRFDRSIHRSRDHRPTRGFTVIRPTHVTLSDSLARWSRASGINLP